MIRKKILSYFEQRPELRVLFVFDPGSFLRLEIEEDATPWPDDVVYYPFEGDWFGTKVRLAGEWARKRVVLSFNQAAPEPGNQEVCRRFPLMSVLMANMVFHEEDGVAFMQQRGLPMQYADFFQRHITELLRDKFNCVLAPHYHPEAFSLDVGHRGIISAYLGSKELMTWSAIVARLAAWCATDRDKALTFFRRLEGSVGKPGATDLKQSLDRKLIQMVGFSYNPNDEERMRQVVEAIKYNAITQLLAADPADPYKQLKVTNGQQIQSINNFLGAVADNPRLAEWWQTAWDTLGDRIREDTLIDIYGPDARYAHLSEGMCRPIVAHIVNQYLYPNPGVVVERLHALSPHLGDGQLARIAHWLGLVARYYEQATSTGTLVLNTPDLYVERYCKQFYLLDQLYRQALSAYVGLPTEARTEGFEEIKRRLDSDYATLANDLNLEWTRCLRERGLQGQWPTTEKQENFYADQKPGQKVKAVVIVSDALRYEMGADLLGRLAGKKHRATLTPMLAGLPTETKYTMDTLLPHESLEFSAEKCEVLVDGQVLGNLPRRTAQLQKYLGDKAVACNYSDYEAMTKEQKRELFKHQLVYLFHDTIDSNCHGANGATFVAATQQALQELAAMVPFIHDTANVSEVWITADHGFLFNDMVFEEKDKQPVEDESLERKSRYYITRDPAPRLGITKKVIKYLGSSEYPTGNLLTTHYSPNYLVATPNGTNRLKAPGGDYEFAHGGASLQEMVIPLIHSTYQRTNVKQRVGVQLLESTPTVSSSRMKVHLIQEEAISMDVQERTVTCGVYVGDQLVSQLAQVILDSTDTLPNNRRNQVVLTVSQQATSKLMQLKVFDIEDPLNPLIIKNIINTTLIDRDF